MLKQFQEIFGSMSKWILLGIFGLAIIVGIILFIFILENIKWVIVTVIVLAVLGLGGYFLYKKYKKPETTAPTA